MNPIIDITRLALLSIFLVLAVYTDLKFGKIYNKLTFPCMVLGLALNAAGGGWHGLLQSLGGVAFVFVLFLVAAPVAGIGGGDTKMMMVVGSLLGFSLMIWAMLFAAVIGGVMSIVVMARHKALLATTRQMASNVYTSFLLRTPVELASGSSRIKFKYSPAIALGTVLAVAMSSLWLL